jgi:DNA/RNA non-specific endonuclease
LINVPPPPLPPLSGLIPPPIPDNSILPGAPTQSNNLPPLEGFRISPPQTVEDLIIESSRAPNGSARVNGYDYEFDGNSRIDNVEGDLSREDGLRNRGHQSGAGGADRLPDDDGGHIVGNRFNPPGEEFNYVAQNSNFNRGSYRQLENEWAQLLADGHTVHVRWDFEYTGDSQRPDGFNVTYHVDDGEPVVRQFQNRHGGK